MYKASRTASLPCISRRAKRYLDSVLSHYISISLVVANAWPSMPASGQMSLHCDWTYTIKKSLNVYKNTSRDEHNPRYHSYSQNVRSGYPSISDSVTGVPVPGYCLTEWKWGHRTVPCLLFSPGLLTGDTGYAIPAALPPYEPLSVRNRGDNRSPDQCILSL